MHVNSKYANMHLGFPINYNKSIKFKISLC